MHQVIAAEKGQQTSAVANVTELYRVVQKPSLFEGAVRQYQPKMEDGDAFPSESTPVQFRADEVINGAFAAWRDLYDLTAHREYGNLVAKANIVVDGVILLENVPAGYLLFLEKRIQDIKTFIGAMPTLDTSIPWSFDNDSGLFNSDVVESFRTKKVEKPLVLYDATDKHPAQTKTTTEDVVVGTWRARRQSGAMRPVDKANALRRIEKLINAVRDARARANLTEAGERPVIFDKISTYVLGA